MRTRTYLSTIAALLLMACDEDVTEATSSPSGGSATAASAADWSSMCVARCGWEQRCATASDPASSTCQTDCESDTTKPEVFRKDAIMDLRSCLSTLSCGSSDDTCFAQAITAIAPDPTVDAGYQSCNARYESCATSDPGSFSDDICVERLLLTGVTQAPLDTCLAGACTQVADCIDVVLGT